MKNKSIGSLILLALLAPSCGSGGGGGGGKGSITPPRWAETYRTPTSADLRAVRFGSPLSGIAAGKFGTFVRTDNGGDTWYSLESTPVQQHGDILSLAVLQTTTFAVGGTPAGASTYTGNMAWQSLDATTFVQPDSPQIFSSIPWVDMVLTGPATRSLAASTLRLRPDGVLELCGGGILGAKDSTVSDTANSFPNVPWAGPIGATGLTIANSTLWFVCGDNGGFGQIRYSQNPNLQVGTFWSTATLPSATTPTLRRIGMVSDTQGFAIGDAGTLLTVDQAVNPKGSAWKNLPGNPITVNLHGMHFLDGDNGWVAGDQGKVYRIRNASTATPIYELMTTGTTENLYDISFVDASHGHAVGNNGIVLRTTNGTSTPALPTWTIKSGPAVNPTPVFNAVDFSATMSVGLAVGNAGTLVRSLNVGSSWTPFNTGISGNLTAVSIPRQGSNTVAFVGTDTGTIYFNNDIMGTGIWAAAGTVTAPALSGIKAILFPKDDTAGIATGVGGKFAKLTYASPGSLTVTGATLSPAPGGTNYAAACDPSGNTLYIGGDAGYLVKSTDGGTIWTAVAGGPAGSIRALQAPTGPNFTLFAGVDDDKVYSLSFSNVWSSQVIAGFGTPASLAFTNDLNGWVVTQGANAGIRFTIDGGGSWFASVPHVPLDGGPNNHFLSAIWMHPSQTGVIVGGNGVIMKTTTGGR